MFELPEFVTFAQQMNETLVGKTIGRGSLGNSPHKFVWYNRTPEEFARLTAGKTVGQAYARGKWLFVPLDPGYILLFGECGGRLLYHQPGAALPAKYHLWLTFADGSALTALTQMWGAMELHEAGQEGERQYVKGMRPTPVEPAFTFDYFAALIAELRAGPKRSVKALLTQEQMLPGLGNAIAQDIMFRASLHPKHPISELGETQQRALYDAIRATVQEVILAGGRNDEFDLFNRPGGYKRVMDSRAAGRPCPTCGTAIEKVQYLGGACYLCPACQV
ncbi:MAG: DNA-formamidopyrimidine glycosylase family protein [Chloroflexota bacterium]